VRQSNHRAEIKKEKDLYCPIFAKRNVPRDVIARQVALEASVHSRGGCYRPLKAVRDAKIDGVCVGLRCRKIAREHPLRIALSGAQKQSAAVVLQR